METIYVGKGSIRVQVWRMKSGTSAFELMQKWRQSDGISAYKGPYFFVANTAGASPSEVVSLLTELQRVAGVFTRPQRQSSAGIAV